MPSMPGSGQPSFRRQVSAETLAPLVGEWAYPPASLKLPLEMLGRDEPLVLRLQAVDGHLRGHVEVFGTFAFYLQEDGSLVQEDAHERFYPVHDADGQLEGFAPLGMILAAARAALNAADDEHARRLLERALEIEPDNPRAREALDGLDD
jgi:hypothetical protein